MVMNNTTYAQLCTNMEQLKLTQMLLHLDEITDFVTTNNLSFTEGLLKLSNYEVDFKEKNVSLRLQRLPLLYIMCILAL